MKFDELVKVIDGIKDPFKKKDLLSSTIVVVKKQLATLNNMWKNLDMSEEDDGERG